MPYTNRQAHGGGIWSAENGDGERIYFAQVCFNGRRYSHRAGEKDYQARALLDDLRSQIKAGTYTPPPSRRERCAGPGRACAR